MAATVPTRRPFVSAGDVSAGAPVRSSTMGPLGAVLNYVRGMGSVVIPQQLIKETIGAGASATYRFRAIPTIFARKRRHLLALRSTSTTTPGYASVVINGGSAVSVAASSSVGATTPQAVLEDITSPSQADSEITYAITAPAGTGIEVVSIGAHDVPRAQLEDVATTGGTDLQTLRAGSPLSAGATDGQVAVLPYDVSGTTIGALNGGRRVGMANWFLAGGMAFTTASPVDLYTTEGPPALGRCLYSGDTTRGLSFAVYAKVSGAGLTGSIRITFTNGSTKTATTTSTSPGWIAAVLPACDAEDLTASDGRRSSRFDVAAIAGWVSVGTPGSVTLYGWSLYESLV